LLLPERARIFTTSRSIILWGKKNATGWWLRKRRLGTLRDAASVAYREHFEPIEDLKAFDLQMLTYFEGPLSQEAIGNREVIEALKSMLRVWRPQVI
jgi:hypothetical protein